MIKAVIMDVDGVIVGNQTGINFPLPHKNVIEALKNLHSKGIPIILCTAKFNFAILEIIKQAGLDNLHISDGGALIINPLKNIIVRKFTIENNIVNGIISRCLKNEIYIEIYTADKYYIQNTQVSDLTDIRTTFLQMKPEVVYSLTSVIIGKDIIKIIIYAKDNSDMPRIELTLKPYSNNISYIWSYLEHTKPLRPCVVTAPKVSKANAVKIITEDLGLSFDSILGIGDSSSDWNFMKLCKYTATLENGDEQIKSLVKSKGEGNFFIAPHINDNGIFDILKFFSLTN